MPALPHSSSRRKWFICLVVAVGLLLTLPSHAQAAGNKGLAISPLKQYLSVDAGKQQTGTITIGNLTDKPMVVGLSVKQFSVADYTYDYHFGNPPNNWLQLNLKSVKLQAGEHRNIPYSLAVPANTAPGGHYYTLVASTQLASGGIASTVQAASLIYVTVSGTLIKTGHLQSSSIQHVVFSKQINYTLNPVNTGNVYYFIYTSGQLHGLFVSPGETPTAHLLVQGTTRHISGTITSPVLPGLYKANYGYKTDAGDNVMHSSYVLYLPPWFIAFVLIVILFGINFRRHRKSV